MGTTADKLNAALDSKNAVKNALENKGLEPTDQFSTYAGLINELENTSDATATEESIMEGAVAYTAKGRTVGKAEPGIPIVDTAGDGEVYTATVPLMTELKAGKKITINPHVTSTTANAKLNVNGLGEKFIRQSLSTNTGATVPGYTDGWILKGKPVTLMYNGTYWISDITRPDANTIYGTTKIENGGTGASTLEGAQDNLGITELLARPVNNNILINSNFANPVNQRGLTEYDSTGNSISHMYTIDRWAVVNQCLLTVNNEYVTLHSIDMNNIRPQFNQWIEFPNKYRGKYVVSAKYRVTQGVDNELAVALLGKDSNAYYSFGSEFLICDGAWHTISVLCDVPISTSELSYLYVSIGSQVTTGCNVITSDISVDIEWVKFEEGEHATPYVPRLYDEEWLLCQRYYQYLNPREAKLWIVETNQIQFVKTFSPMRINPTPDVSQLKLYSKNTAQSGVTFSANVVSDRTITIVCRKTSHGLDYTKYLSIGTGLILDAEL